MCLALAGGASDTKEYVDLFTDTWVDITYSLAAAQSGCVLRGGGGRLLVLLLPRVQRACCVLCYMAVIGSVIVLTGHLMAILCQIPGAVYHVFTCSGLLSLHICRQLGKLVGDWQRPVNSLPPRPSIGKKCGNSGGKLQLSFTWSMQWP